MTEKTEIAIAHAVRLAPYLDPKHARREHELIKTKWPDYAFMTPFQANSHFARTFRKLSQRFAARDYDETTSAAIKGVDLTRLDSDSRRINHVTGARQLADSVGLPYEDFISFSLDFYSRRKRRHRIYINQLGPSDKSEAYWWQGLEEVVKEFSACQRRSKILPRGGAKVGHLWRAHETAGRA